MVVIRSREQYRLVVECVNVLQQADDNSLQFAEFVLIVPQLGDGIEFALPEDSYVEIRIIDMLGREITTLLAGEQSAGTHQILWDGLDESGFPVASGVYFYSMTAEGFSAMRKLLLIK